MTPAPFRLKSMTGYARVQAETALGQILVEVRTVNNRYADITCALPRELAILENAVRAQIKQQVARGKVDVRVRLATHEAGQTAVRLNEPLAAEYIAQIARLREMGVEGELSLAFIAGLPGVLEVGAGDLDEEALWHALQPVLLQALDALDAERRREGAAIGEQLHELGGELEQLIDRVDSNCSVVVQKFRERLLQRIGDLLGEARDQLDPGRLEQEVALFADRADISEEIVRLRSHLARYRQLLAADDGQPVGKNVDFLLQEFNREVNTICSKSRDTELTAIGLEMKSVVERMREQIQNVE